MGARRKSSCRKSITFEDILTNSYHLWSRKSFGVAEGSSRAGCFSRARRDQRSPRDLIIEHANESHVSRVRSTEAH